MGDNRRVCEKRESWWASHACFGVMADENFRYTVCDFGNHIVAQDARLNCSSAVAYFSVRFDRLKVPLSLLQLQFRSRVVWSQNFSFPS